MEGNHSSCLEKLIGRVMKNHKLRKMVENHFQLLKMFAMYIMCEVIKPDSRLIKLKNCYKGKRIFIVATGPSLTLDDVNRLENEITIGVNSCVKFLKDTPWRPSCYLIFDPYAYDELKEDILVADLNHIIYNKVSIPNFCKDGMGIVCNENNTLYEKMHISQIFHKKMKFSDNISKVVYGGHTVVYSALQIAAYMGAKEIYLLGCDCNYRNKEHSTIAGYHSRFFNHLESDGDRMIHDYEEADYYLKKLGIKVYNATRGGMLEVFERVDFYDLFENETM